METVIPHIRAVTFVVGHKDSDTPRSLRRIKTVDFCLNTNPIFYIYCSSSFSSGLVLVTNEWDVFLPMVCKMSIRRGDKIFCGL